jgi:hypothetical protein
MEGHPSSAACRRARPSDNENTPLPRVVRRIAVARIWMDRRSVHRSNQTRPERGAAIVKQQIELEVSPRLDVPAAEDVIAYLTYALEDVRALSSMSTTFLEVAIAQLIDDTSDGHCLIVGRPQRLS